MNRGIFLKTLRDSTLVLAIVCACIFMLEILLTAVLGEFMSDIEVVWLKNAFIQRLFRLLMGGELDLEVSATGFISIGFGHPVMYAFAWTFILGAGTRVIANEIDRGTADLLLAMPVSRPVAYISISAALALAIVPLTLAVPVGVWIGEMFFPLWEPIDFSRLWRLAANLAALHLCVCAATLMASSFASRRGPALGAVLGWLLCSFFLEFVRQFSDTADALGFLGILHFYRPLPTVSSAGWPFASICALLLLAGASWWIGLVRFARRDIPAV